MAFPLDIPKGVYKNEEKRWVRICPSCKNEVTHLRRNYCIGADVMQQPCKKMQQQKQSSIRHGWRSADGLV